MRSFSVPLYVDAVRISTEFKDGVQTINAAEKRGSQTKADQCKGQLIIHQVSETTSLCTPQAVQWEGLPAAKL